YCTNVGVGKSDVDVTTQFSGAASAELKGGFHVGAGTVQWTNDRGFTNSITCAGAGSSCFLVVRVEITDTTVYSAAPLCFGSGWPAEPATVPDNTPITAQPGVEPQPSPTAPAAAAAPLAGAVTTAPPGSAPTTSTTGELRAQGSS